MPTEPNKPGGTLRHVVMPGTFVRSTATAFDGTHSARSDPANASG
jgi:hypothetical protein